VCGVIAMFGAPEATQQAVRSGLDLIRHRGPDACGEWHDRHAYLGHRRLAIIDLATGQQPMHSGDGRYVISFNGEIYNYRELRAELLALGAEFQTHSDTEVILEGYRFWGRGVLDRLNGMFAFAIWDRSARLALIARDRLGIKPLCWGTHQGTLLIASTLEPFSLVDAFSGIDAVAVRDLLTFDYIPAPRTIRKGVRKLEPGSWLEWRSGDTEPQQGRYWSAPPADDNLATPEEDELEVLLDRAVSRQMVSDVPIGVFLSGGIDSSLLVAFMARHSSRPVRTYSVAFAQSGYDESSIASQVAAEFGTEHVCIPAEQLTADAVRELLGALDEPFCDSALVPLYSLSRQTRQHVKVALGGDGADEVFGGYHKYIAATQGGAPAALSALVDGSLRALPWRPRGIGSLYERTLSGSQRLRYAWSRYGDFPVFRKDLTQVLSPGFIESASIDEFFEPWERHSAKYGGRVDSDVLMRVDLETYLSENCLVKTDRASMLASLEVRVPYLDETVLDRILPLPAERKILEGELKALLRNLARRLLPRAVWDRPKHGFNVPVESNLATTWNPLVVDALDWGERHFPVFNYAYLRRLHDLSRREAVVGHELWNPVVTLAWAMAQSRPLSV